MGMLGRGPAQESTKKIRNILACGKTYALSCCLRQGVMIGWPEQAAEGLE